MSPLRIDVDAIAHLPQQREEVGGAHALRQVRSDKARDQQGEQCDIEPAGVNPRVVDAEHILEAVGGGLGPHHLLVTLGYAGWAQGQLEHELSQNAWLSVSASEHILFELPAEERLPAAMALLGVDYASLSEDAGHA